MVSEPEILRRIGNLEKQMQWMDEHGTRGVSGLQIQFNVMQRDLGKIEKTVGSIDEMVDTLKQRSSGPQILAFILAMLPLYALVIAFIVRG